MLAYFGLTLFVSAFLLFLVQPMIGKMILPRLGGTPAVWNTCMVFFQAVLLVGYAYTHTVSTQFSRKSQLLAQSALLLLPLAVLPFAIGDWTPDPEASPIFAVLLLMLGMVGLPFFVVSTSAPLLQKWFGHTGHPAAKDPYFLYGASNLGSMLALLAYPTLVEPWLGVDEQAVWWTASYGIFLLLVLGCVGLVWLSPEPSGVSAARPAEAAPAPLPAEAPPTAISVGRRRALRRDAALSTEPAALPAERDIDALTLGRRLRWIGLAAVPSSLMLGVTTYMTTDIAAIPFFLVVPLALYLMTFILVFARWPVVWTTWPHEVVLYMQPCATLFLVLIMIAHPAIPMWVIFFFHILAFFTTALMCHGELAKDRPSPRHLTEFYLWMSLGGVLGGTFNALVAPLVLRTGIWEYPIAMVFAFLLRPNLVTDKPIIPNDSTRERWTPTGWALDFAIPGMLGLLTLALMTWSGSHGFNLGEGFVTYRMVSLGGLCMILLLLAMRPLRIGLGLAAILLTVTLIDRSTDPLVFEDRGFFGLIRVRETEEIRTDEDGTKETYVYRTLVHGGIDHGRQFLQPERLRATPTTYFHPSNGVGELYGKFSWPNARLPASLVGLGALGPWSQLVTLKSEPPYAVLGLGTGTLAAHARPLQTAHFYEIDPLVRDLSLPPHGGEPIFYYLQDALDRGADLHVLLGDGRLLIENPVIDGKKVDLEKYYHIISLDAFSSDAIPVHLLTKEAIEAYLKKLADGGVLIFNTTNRYVRIEGPLAAIAEELQLDCLYCGDYTDNTILDKYAADWLVMQRKPPPGGFVNGGLPIRQRLSRTQRDGEGREQKRWEDVTPLEGPVWTDNYSNLLRVMKWKS